MAAAAVKEAPRPMAAPVSELEAALLEDAEQEIVTKDEELAGEAVDARFATLTSSITSPQAQARGRNFVRSQTSPKRQLYTYLGDVVEVVNEDVPIVTDVRLPPEQRRYRKCPRCGTQHKDRLPNSCPAIPEDQRRMAMRCPICLSHGRILDVYELTIPDAGQLVDVANPDLIAPLLPDRASREKRLQGKLEAHMLGAHRGEAESQYGLRKTVVVSTSA